MNEKRVLFKLYQNIDSEKRRRTGVENLFYFKSNIESWMPLSKLKITSEKDWNRMYLIVGLDDFRKFPLVKLNVLLFHSALILKC